MSKYIVNMADQLNLIRANAQEKLRKEAEVVVEVEKPSALQTAAVDYLSRKDEPHPLSQNKNLNEETLDEGKMDGAAKDLEKEAKQNKGSMDEKSYKVMAKLMKQGNPKQILSYYKGLDTEPRERIAMILKKNIGEKQAGKILSVSFSNNREEVELDENVNSDIKKILDKEKISYKIQTSKHPLGQKGIITGVFVQAKDEKKASIALGKISPYPHTITTHAEEVELDEYGAAVVGIGRAAVGIGRAGAKSFGKSAGTAAGGAVGGAIAKKINSSKEKSVRQLINPTKEVMVVKKNKVVVIDKKDPDKYMKQGWTLAEEVALEEARWKVKIEGLPPIYMDSSSAGEVKAQLRKLIKKPDMIQDIERVTDAEVNKALRNKISGKEVEEAKLREEVGLDEKIKIEFKTDPKNSNKTMIMKKGKHQGDIIKTNKGYQVMQFNKPAGKIFKSLDDIKPAVRKLYGEAKLIDKPTGEVLKTGSKEKMETEKKRNRDELQVKEWFKSKNIDVKVRELDESTQVYVPLGRRIPNEIREELIKTQYGKMPEDVKNVKDINYGNFMENSITMNNDFWTKVLHDTKGE